MNLGSREFDKGSYVRNDSLAKEKVRQYYSFHHPHIELKDNPSQTGIDLIMFNRSSGECVGYIECERAETWWTYEGKYTGRINYSSKDQQKYVRIPGRKMHFLEGKDAYDYRLGNQSLPHGNKPITFITINSLGTDLISCSADLVKELMWIEEDNTNHSRSGSKFICSPIDAWTHGKITPKAKRVVRVESTEAIL